jgi:hypothetical protein
MNDPDLSAIDLETISGVDLLPWQKQTFDTIYGGFKRGQIMTFTAGRATGKSTLTTASLKKLLDDMEMLAPSFEVLTTADVDGEPWYTVSCRKEVSIWIRENGEEDREWYSHIDSKWMIHRNVFDVSQTMMAMVKLRWGS